MRQKLLVLVLFAALLPFGAAQAQPMVQSQEGIALENQILHLQQQVQQLQSSGGGGGNGGSVLGGAAQAPSESSTPVPPGQGNIVASLLTQVQQLQSQVQELSGKVDTLQNQVNTQHDATEKEIGDLKFQMGQGATPGAAPRGAPQSLTGPASAPPAPPQAAPSGSPKDVLRGALAAYAKGNYAAADAGARSVLASSKNSPEAYRAQYLLAQSLAAEGKNQDAAIAYDGTYNMNRTGTWAPQSLLGLANSLAAIGQNEAACDTLSSLNSQFPTPPSGMGAHIQAVSKRAHCS
ncbi:MAG: hypothetical protein B7X08_07325 [Acidocella sp. 20-63-7]|nr:MAG: hypothetical protein B7X08_07325 [Acidocella sp. 20-63-7]HQT47378.1 hypothetical protein [Acidocella sp.]